MKKTIRDIDIDNKKVFVRCDFNVPLDENGNITDNKRIVESLPTIKYLIEHNCKIILSSHLGRPKGEVKPEFSLKPVRDELAKLLERDVTLIDLGAPVPDDQIVLLENIRFDAREEENDPEFAKELASMAEIFVNDAFGSAHRAHASTAGIAEYLPSVSGFLIEKELKYLGEALDNPKRPYVAILGGKKVSDKIEVINNLLEKVDRLLIGGGMAYTFFRSMGYNIGTSVCEEDKLDLASELINKAREKGVDLVLPIDDVIADNFDENANTKVVKSEEIPEGWMALDIGPEAIEQYKEKLQDAGTVVWNGPLGYSEWKQFANGTDSVAEYLASKNGEVVTVVGGGDSAAAIQRLGLQDKFTHISTGGGASLEYLEGKKLPGIECLEDA